MLTHVGFCLFWAYAFLKYAPALELIRAAGSSGRGLLPRRRWTQMRQRFAFQRQYSVTFGPFQLPFRFNVGLNRPVLRFHFFKYFSGAVCPCISGNKPVCFHLFRQLAAFMLCYDHLTKSFQGLKNKGLNNRTTALKHHQVSDKFVICFLRGQDHAPLNICSSFFSYHTVQTAAPLP